MNDTAVNVTAGNDNGENDGAGNDRVPLLRIVNGAPTEAELAALVSVLAARSAASRATSLPGGARPSSWSAPWRRLQVPLPGRPGGWRNSALPS
jgi:acyl-CoA carboxylase epsilon subunit